MEIKIDGANLTIEKVRKVARDKAKVVLTPDAEKRVSECRKTVEQLVEDGAMIYGVTTGIGEFAKIKVSPEFGAELQKRIVYSHAAGVGDFFEEDEVRAAMLLRANVLSKGYSAVRLSTLKTLIDMINKGVIPAINEKGSVGASGDLSPLSQMAEVVMGEGRAFYKGRLMSGKEVMRKAGIKPVKLSFKEGLGLINGSQMFTGCGALYLYDAIRVAKTAQIASAMTIDALKSPVRAFDQRIHELRPFNGQNVVAENIRRLVEESEILAEGSPKVQDAYSLRCIPQVYGPSVDALRYVRQQIEIEMNSAADNPLFIAKDKAHLACGNFHGQPVAMALDFLAIAMTEVSSLSERHINRLLNPNLSKLPDFLVEGKGLNSGLMVAHYTAASLVSENRLFAHPAVVDNSSLAADQEDHVSMGPIAAKKGKEIIKNTINVLAIEIMCSCQAFDFRKGKRPGKGGRIVYEIVRKDVPRLVDDRVLYPDIQKIAEKIKNLEILDAVEKEVGALKWEM